MSLLVKQPVNPYNQLYKREMANDELAEIQHNLFGFFDVLIQLDQICKEQSNETPPTQYESDR